MRNTYDAVHAAFGTVVVVVCVIGLLAAVAALAVSGRTWDEYGKDLLLMERDGHAGGGESSAAVLRERDDEIRQMLEARNARRQRRGERPIDIEQELARLTAPQIDAGLRTEIRDLVIARNHRRVRAGKPPLDVEAEVERQIADLGSLSGPATDGA